MGNGRPEKYKIEQVIEAIRGSGAIKATIAQRLGCNRHTVDRYLEQYITVRQAYENEGQLTDDYAESLVRQNIMIGLKRQQEEQVLVDSSDAKWWLERRRRDKFATRQELDHSGSIETTLIILPAKDNGK